MLVKKLRRHGNSMAIIVDRSILALLGINADTPLAITTEGGRLIIEPLRTEPPECCGKDTGKKAHS